MRRGRLYGLHCSGRTSSRQEQHWLAGSLAGWLAGCLAWAARAACHALLYITICELKTADLGPLQSIKPLLRASCTYLLAFTRNYSTYFEDSFYEFGRLKKNTLGFPLCVLVLLYILFWFLVDCTVHFHYCITLRIIRTVLKKWIILLIFITVLLFLLYVLFSKPSPVTCISTGLIIGT